LNGRNIKGQTRLTGERERIVVDGFSLQSFGLEEVCFEGFCLKGFCFERFGL
jgi:hypothetical protein